ncbi:tripartite tricarboxylate transporter substrate-binding protein [Pseudarthrobacter enclensis]|jgi:putative tricarboxylic transport membrane protein|uniref:C4-dicarboxylate ABC transporter substrate-binding protein n=1 Tax=Pseudarthrobacter enclensis TaxID=993070 RepID=A0A0V8IGY9_9MICC|nr:tripartite tricarboxylate transporter substrate-binding protein [Pseudarthrobacter enclensis]KSU74027.1 C4-dicarboxylate ABC transporter substrate-binding protein [Pseudarthrobacter enclensis]MBT2247444.1 tripartite tricarboxylate transporter substrate binding protein [Arthrobacter sp. BHU FT2]SCC21365.1 putative tricarboxylic transport membrane protein [Pseudarthrobacter enclensis]
MRQIRALRIAAVAAGIALMATGCGATGKSSTGTESSGSAAAKPITGLQIMVPNTPGGGYDTTARAAAKVLDDEKISTNTEVFNLAGAGGTVGLARVVNEKGNGDLAMLMGLGVVGASYTNKSESKLTETTPLARLIEEPGAIMVSKDSPYKTIDDLVKAWKADPGSIAVGGGSSPGGPDHLLPMQLAGAVGIDATKVNFVSYDGGGDLLPAILGNKLGFAASGAGEYLKQIESGEVRVLATSGEKRLEGVDAPTLKESNIDLVFTNWRGIVAPPGISDEDKASLIAALEKMHGTEGWKEALKTHGWTDAFITGDEFKTFLTEQDKRVADVLTKLGLA